MLTTAALVAAVVAYVAVTRPPASINLNAPLPANVVVGAYHIHTMRSDGAGTPEDVAVAAAAAGVRFAIMTDHGDATRVPDAPRYVNGVLLIDAVEISTNDGHVVALGLPGAAPYPLAGEGRDVIEDIHRLGGFAIVAHPDSQRTELRWRAPGGMPGGGRGGAGGQGSLGDLAGADGIEWLNADSEWRKNSWPRLLHTALRMSSRPAESFAELIERPAQTLRRWDALTRRRPVIGLAAIDAHGFFGGFYTASFKSFVQAVVLASPMTGDAAADASSLLEAMCRGRTFSVVTGVASASVAQLTATDGVSRAEIGGRLEPAGATVRIDAATPGASGARVVILRDDREVGTGMGHATVTAAAPGAYRMEAWLGNGHTPWIVTNPVYVAPPADATPSMPPGRRLPAQPQPQPTEVLQPFELPLLAGPQWAVEHGPSSTGSIDAVEDRVAFRYQVGTAQPGLEYAALARSLGDGNESFDRVQFMASASHPMRVSVQFRLPGTKDGERWARSVYVDQTPRPITVRMSDVVPVGFSATRRPVVARVKSILFVMDTVNAAPGTAGVLSLSGIRLMRSPTDDRLGADGQQQVGRPGQEQNVRRPGRNGGRQ